MVTETELKALRQAFESMDDDEVDAWLAAHDFASVRGVALPAEAAARVEALVAGVEVEGFSLDFSAIGGGGQLPPLDGANTSDSKKGGKGGALFKYCCTGEHIKVVNVTH